MAKRLMVIGFKGWIYQGLKHLLQTNGHYDVIEGNHLTIEKVKDQVDIVFFDQLYFNEISISALKVFSQHFPFQQSILVCTDIEEQSVRKAMKLGLRGFLTKDCDEEEILEALETVSRQGEFFCDTISQVLNLADKPILDVDHLELSQREMEVLKLIAKGFSSQQIADEMFVSPHTVNVHRKNILKKMKVGSPVEMIVKAIQLEIISI